MEQPYGQPPAGQQPQATPPVPPTLSYGMPQPNYSAPPRGWQFGRMLRLLALRLGSGIARIGRVLRPYWLTAIIATILGAVIAVEAGVLVIPPLVQMALSQRPQRAAAIPPASAVESYIKGQQAFDANLIWNSFSDTFKSEMRQQGRSQTTIENEVEQNRATGKRYVKFDYVGGVETAYGDTFYYMVEIASPSPQQSGVFAYVFTVGPDEKIIGFEEGLPAH